MEIEYEAKFININKNEIRNRFKNAGAELVRPEYLQRRVPFNLPGENPDKHIWLRVRDEGDKVTLSLKEIKGDKIQDQKESQIVVSDFEKTCEMLKSIGCAEKSYQESKRELWILEDAEITIDEWPFCEPYIEIEGKSEEKVKEISEKLGFNYSQAIFGSVGKVLSLKYGIPEEIINNNFPKLIFGAENPFVKYINK